MSKQIVATEAWLNLVRNFPEFASSDAVLALLDEIGKLKSGIAKRPVVYCARNKVTNRMLTLGGFVVLLHPGQRSAWEDGEWTTEIYTGEQLP